MRIFQGKRVLTAYMLIAGFFITIRSYPATYYVSPTGSNTTGDGSAGYPWQTISYGESQLSSGDILVLRGGTYSGSDNVVTFDVSNVTIQNYQGETPVLDGDNWTFPQGDYPSVLYAAFIRITGNNCTLKGLTVQYSRGMGIDAMDSKGTTIRNCVLHHNLHSGVAVGRAYVAECNNIVEYCEVYFNNHARDNGAFSAWSNIAQNIKVQGDGNIIRYNTVYYSPAAGIEGRGDDGTQIYGNIIYGNKLTQIHFAESKNAIIYNNLIYGVVRPGVSDTNGYGTGIDLACELWYSQTANGGGWDQGHKAYNNMVAWTKMGIRIGWNTGKNRNYASNAVSNFSVYNNTVIEPSTVQTISNLQHALVVLSSKDSYGYNHLGSGHVIKNNLFWQSISTRSIAYDGLEMSEKVTLGYNLWSKEPSTGFQDPADPAYPDYPTLDIADYFAKTIGWDNLEAGSLSADDFKLSETAVNAIDKGTDLGEPYQIDYFGTARTQGAAWDIGACESPFSIGVGIPKINEQEGLRLNVYPNPSYNRLVTITYELPDISDVTIQIMDRSGRIIKSLSNKKQGKMKLQFDTGDYAPGVYFCRLITDNKMVIKKIIME